MSSRRSASGGSVELHHVQAVVQVLAELARGDALLELAVRGRDDAHVDRRSRRCEPTGRTSRSSSARSSFTCSASGMSPISSRNSVPPSAAWNRPRRSCDRAGEGALLVAEQLGLEQALGNRAAVHRDERRVGARGWRGGWRARAAPCRCRSRRRCTRSHRTAATRCAWREQRLHGRGARDDLGAPAPRSAPLRRARQAQRLGDRLEQHLRARRAW